MLINFPPNDSLTGLDTHETADHFAKLLTYPSCTGKFELQMSRSNRPTMASDSQHPGALSLANRAFSCPLPFSQMRGAVSLKQVTQSLYHTVTEGPVKITLGDKGEICFLRVEICSRSAVLYISI